MADINDVLQIARVFKSQAEADLMNDTYSKVLPTNMISFCDAVKELLQEQKNLVLALEQSNASNKNLNYNVSELGETINILKDRIKQLQTKQKPKNDGNFCRCGKCDEFIMRSSQTVIPINREKVRFCSHCGQPIDWMAWIEGSVHA